jgi:tetratricopeptide (TPR) repeat protein
VAGNRQVFEQAMRQGTNYAWDRQWDKAIVEYERAVAEFPEAAPAYTALGQALVHAGRVEDALEVYQRAARLTPDDASALGRVAELQEQLGDTNGAARTWLHTADLHLRRQDVDQAVRIWQRLIKIAPHTAPAYERLGRAYAGMGQTRKAIRHYLMLAAIHQETGDDEQATTACQWALKLDPRDSDVLTAWDALQHGRSLSELVKPQPISRVSTPAQDKAEGEGGVDSPVAMTRQKAMTELADSLLEDSGLGMEFAALLLQGIDHQTRGDVQAAIESYERAIAGGINHVGAHFNLGLLYQEALRFEDAVEEFQWAIDDSGYALGARFALGECLRALGRVDEALKNFISVLERLDLSTVRPEEADDLQRSYDALANDYAATKNHDEVVAFTNTLVQFLSGEQWEDRVFGVRQQLNRLGGARVVSMAEMLVLPEAELVLGAMVRSKDYLAQGMITTAEDECFWALEHAPTYLPLHLHMADLLMKENRVEDAIRKHLFVADTFAARDEIGQAMSLYEQVLRMAPMDLDVRRKLIALLQDHNMVGQSLEHRLALAEAYYELAQAESAREQYEEALRVASRLADGKKWTARILHRLGDVDLQRLDWRSAVKVFLQLKKAVPEDMKARQRLVELYFNLQRRAEAVAEMDEFITLCRREGTPQKALDVIQELAETRPDEMELHKRAAQLSIETGHKEGAIAHLDAMGEWQLQEGRVQEAVATIKAIIALGPENADAYRQLLEQIA